MTAADAQSRWCQWPLTERLDLLASWQARQSIEVRLGLGLLSEQAPASTQRVISQLPDGRRLLSSYGPLGEVELHEASRDDATNLIVHLAWACALGNAVLVQSQNDELLAAVAALRDLLVLADPALATLVEVKQAHDEKPNCKVRTLSTGAVHMVVAPSADVPLLVKHALRASRAQGLVLWVNHSLHHEVKRRMPEATLIEGSSDIQQAVVAGDLYLAACGAVDEKLQQLHRLNKTRSALYSSDWIEIEAACDGAAVHGALFAVNTLEEAPLSLLEARASYQKLSLTVISHAEK